MGDPVIGIRVIAPFAEHWSFVGYADIGGFGMGSDITYQVIAGVTGRSLKCSRPRPATLLLSGLRGRWLRLGHGVMGSVSAQDSGFNGVVIHTVTRQPPDGLADIHQLLLMVLDAPACIALAGFE
ncbi:MAG: hypothetical protein MZV65_18315 [Chromatiales bacterium]|nr:hypothetical protein [Chromatiales bacterium]